MTLTNLTEYDLHKNIRVLGTNDDKHGLRHVSIFESKFYPFVGVQFHPEAVLFEFKDFRGHHNIPHNLNATRLSQYFANYFVEQTRENSNCFESQDELNAYSIHNYQPQFTAASKDDRYIQKYFFPLWVLELKSVFKFWIKQSICPNWCSRDFYFLKDFSKRPTKLVHLKQNKSID